MIDGQITLWHALPILLILFSFVGGLLVRLTTNAAKPHRDFTYQPKVSVLLPVYNEGAAVTKTIESILAADWPADKLQIVAIDDRSADDSYAHMELAQARHPEQLIIGRNEVNSGKHMTLVAALEKSAGDVVICIDSDCLFDKNVIKELVACFADPQVGAVGGCVGVSNINTNIYTLVQTIVYFMTFQIGKMMQSAKGRMFVISGALFAVRRTLFKEIEVEIQQRSWMGLKVRDGEDRFMTHTILLRGWKTIINPAAICWTAVPDNFAQLFSQQLRWRRSSLRDLVWTLGCLPRHFRSIGVVATFIGVIPSLFLLLWAFCVLASVAIFGVGAALTTAVLSLALFCSLPMVIALVYNRTIETFVPGSELIKYPLLAGFSGVWFIMDSLLITILALCTFDIGTWGTRESVKEAVKGEKATA